MKYDLCEAHMNLGWIYQSKGYLDMAYEHYRECVVWSKSPKIRSSCYCNIARLHLDRNMNSPKKYIEALRILDRAVSENVPSVDLSMAFGDILFQSGDYDASIKHYEAVLAMDPSHYTATLNIGHCYYQKNQMQEALYWYNASNNLVSATQ